MDIPAMHLVWEMKIKLLKEAQHCFERHQMLPLFVQQKNFEWELHDEHAQTQIHYHVIVSLKLSEVG